MSERFTIVDHVCRRCLGRLVESAATGAVRCLNCGASAPTLTAVCVCGLTVGGTVAPGRDAGLRCVRNPFPSRVSPAQIVVALVTAPAPKDGAAADERVASGAPRTA